MKNQYYFRACLFINTFIENLCYYILFTLLGSIVSIKTQMNVHLLAGVNSIKTNKYSINIHRILDYTLEQICIYKNN